MSISVEMNPEQIALVQTTFHQLAANAQEVADKFYTNFFTYVPELRPLFPNDMDHQGDKFMATLAILIFSLEQSGEVPPFIYHLGLRHKHHGIPHSAYAVAGPALLQTLGEMLGSAFTTEVEQAWKKLFGCLANAMKAGEYKEFTGKDDRPVSDAGNIANLNI